jgi:F-type H+-transporting ATPase subunit delta
MRHSIHRAAVAAPRRACYARAGGQKAQRQCDFFGHLSCSQRAADSPGVLGRKLYQVTTDGSMTASMAGRYAVALFELAKESKQLPQLETDLKSFQGMLDHSQDLRRLVRSPVISAEDQAKALGAILQRAGISGLTASFFKLIVRNRRLFAIADMLKDFRTLLARERGEVSADVTSAHTLTADQINALKDALHAQVGKDVQINTRVDPNLLGGLIVKVGSRMIDSSLRTKLNNLRVAMKGIG